MNQRKPSVVRRSLAFTAVAAAGAMLLAACSGSSSSDATAAASQAPASAAASQDAGAAGIEAAKAAVAEYLAPVTSWPEVSPLSAPPDVEGKTIWWVPFGTGAPVINAIGVNMADALSQAGATVKTCDGKFNPTEVGNCLKLAGDQGAAAVVTGFVDYAMVPAAFEALVEKGIPVVIAGVPASGDRVADDKLVFVDSTPRVSKNYSMLSNIAIADGGENTKALWIRHMDSSLTQAASDAAVETFKANCPTCELVTVDMTVGNLDKVGGTVSAALVANPDINVVIVPVDSIVPSAVQGITSAGAQDKVKIVSAFGDLDGLQRVANGQQFADAGNANAYTGWTFANSVMQMLAGDPVSNDENYVGRVFYQADTKGLELTPEAYNTLAWYSSDDSFKQQMLSAWGVK